MRLRRAGDNEPDESKKKYEGTGGDRIGTLRCAGKWAGIADSEIVPQALRVPFTYQSGA
jgi:hypothetical protein